jgi:hypothetical protein
MDDLFTRAEKNAINKARKEQIREYVKEYLAEETKKQARAIVREFRADIKAQVREEFVKRLPAAIKNAVGKIHMSVNFWTNAKRVRFDGKVIKLEETI